MEKGEIFWGMGKIPVFFTQRRPSRIRLTGEVNNARKEKKMDLSLYLRHIYYINTNKTCIFNRICYRF